MSAPFGTAEVTPPAVPDYRVPDSVKSRPRRPRHAHAMPTSCPRRDAASRALGRRGTCPFVPFWDGFGSRTLLLGKCRVRFVNGDVLNGSIRVPGTTAVPASAGPSGPASGPALESVLGLPAPHPRTLGWVRTAALAMGGSNQSLFLLGALLVAQGQRRHPAAGGGSVVGSGGDAGLDRAAVDVAEPGRRDCCGVRGGFPPV